MARFRFLIIVFFALTLSVFPATGVQALKCAEVPEFSHQTIEDAPFIFEGRLERTRDLTEEERAAAGDIAAELKTVHGDTDQAAQHGLKIYEYTVTHNWKGMKRDTRVPVLFDSEWGNSLNFGENALIVGEEKIGEMIWVPLCGPSSSISDAQDRGMIGALREVIGIGYDVKVRGADRICRAADDCTAVSTRCGGCDCGVPIAITAVKKHQKKLSEYCAASADQSLCESPECKPYQPSCIEGQCR